MRHLAKFVVCLIIYSGITGTARGEPKLVDVPADHFAVAPGGVDMRTGRYTYSAADLQIGGDEKAGGLSLTRIMPDYAAGIVPFANFSHNWAVTLVERRIGINQNEPQGQDYKIGIYYAGRSLTFESLSNHTDFTPKGGGSMFLTYANGTRGSTTVVYTLRAPDGTVMTFKPIGNYSCVAGLPTRCAVVSEILQIDGTKLTFDYDGTFLRQVVSSRGYAILLEGGGGVIAKACVLNLAIEQLPTDKNCPAGVPTLSYGYTTLYDVPGGGSRAALNSVTAPTGYVSAFTYGSGTIGFVKPGQSTPWLVNTIRWEGDEDGVNQEVIAHQAFSDGQSYDYSYIRPPANNKFFFAPITGGLYVDALGRGASVEYGFPISPGTGPFSPCYQTPCNNVPAYNGDNDFSLYQTTRGPAKVIDPGGRTTIYNYCDPVVMAGLPAAEPERCAVVALQWFVDGEGIRTELKHDGAENITEVRRKAKPGSGLADILSSATYDQNCSDKPKYCHKPLSVTDARGQVTNYTYSIDHGGVLSETMPPNESGVRAQSRYTYVPRYAWVKSGGGYVQGSAPMWLLAETRVCRTSAAVNGGCAGGASDEVVTRYDYGPDSGPNTLLLRGKEVAAGGLSLRTCYRYDARGDRISETSARAGLASCS